MIARLHSSYVSGRRTQVLARHLAGIIPPNAHVLDIGCGDGVIGRSVLGLRSDLQLEGIDVLVRPQTAIPVKKFDGSAIPHPDRSFDVALMVDVLHHADNPFELLREGTRVAEFIVIKDHLRNGFLAATVLKFMDFVGNAHHGVALPFNYWSETEWTRAFEELDLYTEERRCSLGLYPKFASWIFERNLHFVAKLRVKSARLINRENQAEGAGC